MEKLEETASICPECFKEGKINKIPAEVIEEDGKVWLKKECPQHGKIKSIIFNDSALYHKWMKYKVTGNGSDNVEIKSWLSPEDQLYDKHRSQTVLTNLMLTNRCNLRCSYCFMNAGEAGYIYEPSLEQLREMMKKVREEKPVPSKALQLTGGEPTVRDDLFEIIKMAKDLGFSHIQLNTNGIKLAESADYCREIMEAGVKTIYLSFDGISKETNPWIENNKRAVENLRKGGITSIILVPVVMHRNLGELAGIVRYAMENVDVIRGINFQPLAFAGRPQNVSDEYRLKERVDYTDMMKALEEGLDGQVTMDDFYPVPFIHPISKVIENITGKKQIEFTANPMCGGATYVFIEDGKLLPITRFVDVEGFMRFVGGQVKITGGLKKIRIGAAFLKEVPKFINKEKTPKGLDITKLLLKTAVGGTYGSLREFQYKTLYLGTMWFQDVWNLNIDRLKRCVIHYSTPEGVIPFCAYNGLGIGDKIRKKYSIPVEEWEKKVGRKLRDDLWKRG